MSALWIRTRASTVSACSPSGDAAMRRSLSRPDARSQGPAGPEDRRPLHPDPDHRDRRRHRDHRRHGRPRPEVPPPRGQQREPEADPRQHPARDRLDDRCRRCSSRSSRCRPSPPSSTWPRTPGPTALQVTVEGKQWWWQFALSRRQGRHRRRAGDPDRARRVRAPHRVRRQRRRRRLQRHPQLLGPGALRQEGRRPRPDQHAHARRPTSPAPTSGSAPSTAASRTPTCASG